MQSPQNKIIGVEGVWLAYDGKVVLEDVNLDIFRGDFMLLTGPNGGGKTSLLRIILGLQKPTMGRVSFYPTPPDTGYLPQKNSIDSRFPISVEEVVASGLTGCAIDKAQSREATEKMLELMGITDLRSKAIGDLSGGQLQRTLLGRALISQPDMLILDEPSSYVDQPFGERMLDILQEQSQAGKTILMVSHDAGRISSLASRTLYVDHRIESR